MGLQVIIIGPMCCGKSSVSHSLSEITGLPLISLDLLKWYYYAKQGLAQTALSRFIKSKNINAYLNYIEPFEINVVESILKDFDNGIFDFGAGQTYYRYEKNKRKIASLFLNNSNVFMLLPTNNNEQNKIILDEKLRQRSYSDDEAIFKIALNKIFIANELNLKISKNVIFTYQKTLNEIINEIKNKITNQCR